MTIRPRIDPFLSGNYAPIQHEDDIEDVPVQGSIPQALAGTFFRNGPNPHFPPRDQNHHWFLGDGMVHAFRIESGKVRYFNRYVRTPKWRAEDKAGRALFGSWGNPMTTDPSVSLTDSGVANTNIIWHAGRLLALEEGHQPFELDPETLAPRGYCDYAGAAKRFTAHPKIDPETGELVFFGYGVGDMPLSAGMAYGIVGSDGRVRRLDRFDAPFPSMVHDFLVTREHVLFPILPLTASLSRAMQGGPAFAWEPDRGAFVGVMKRNAAIDTIRWFRTDPCYVFHPMNAYEKDGRIIADVMQYETAPLFPNPDGSRGKASAARLARWTIALSGNTDSVKSEMIDDMAGEFPRLDERRAGLPYRHGYFAASSKGDTKVQFDAIAHIDHVTGKRVTHVFADGDFTGEPVFIPRSQTAGEGDGYLATIVYRGAENRSDFVLLDATDVAKGPVAVAKLPHRVPYGFHGNWMAA